MRLFAGLDLPEPVLHSLDARIAPLRPLAPLSWAPLENLHITTKFIGDWPEEKLDLLKQELAEVATPGPIPIQLEGLGWFPNPHSPRVFWVAIRSPESLELLAKETDLATAKLGVEPETRQFRPHLTLARIKAANLPLTSLRQGVAKMESVDFGSFVAQSFFLYLSEPSAKVPATNIRSSRSSPSQHDAHSHSRGLLPDRRHPFRLSIGEANQRR